MKPFALEASSFCICLLLCWIGIKAAPRIGLLDIPGGRRQHDAPIPRIGGLALIATILLAAFVAGVRIPLSRLEMGAVCAMSLLGLIDDLLDLRARWKAALGLGLAMLLAFAAVHSLRPNLAGFELLGLNLPAWPSLFFLLLTLLFWGIPQAFNLIDGANGLATGFALVVLGSLWAVGHPHPVVSGALLACLVLNWPKAKLFLGDCGSLSAGLVLVIYAQKALLRPDADQLLWLFAYPIIDVSTVILIRALQRRPIFLGDRSHLHHQIADRWPSLQFLSVPLLLAIAALCASHVYVSSRWAVLPYLGLAILVGLAASFIFASVVKDVEEPEVSTPDLLATDPRAKDLAS